MRYTLIGFAAVLVVIIVISVAVSHGGGGVSTTASGHTETGKNKSGSTAKHTAQLATIGSYFDIGDGSGDTYRVTLLKVINHARGANQFAAPDHGNRFVAAVFEIKALKGSPQGEDANDNAAIVGSNGQSYTADFDPIKGYTNFNSGQIAVAQGDSTIGAVTFQVPKGVKVSKVQWSDSSGFGSTVQWTVP